MKKYLALIKYEMKTLLKDSMNLFMLFYPVLMLMILGLLLPLMLKDVNDQTKAITLQIALAVSFSVGGYVSGAMLGFMLIENKDENTLVNIAVTPITVKGYTLFKIIYIYILGIIGNLLIVGGLKLFAGDSYIIQSNLNLLDNLEWLNIIIFALVNSLFAPIIGCLLASLAKNKIEAFAFIKFGGFIVMMPLLILFDFFKDWKQYFLGIFPNFWSVKAMMNLSINSSNPNDLNFYIYMLIGAVYLTILGIISLKFFVKKNAN